MDKQTLSNYGWVVIAVLVLSVMIALATPFGEYIAQGVESTRQGLFDASEKALNVVGMSAGEGSFESGSGSSTPTKDPALNPSGTIPEGATYIRYINPRIDWSIYEVVYDEVITYNAGESFPTPQTGDMYHFGDYEYCYGAKYCMPDLRWGYICMTCGCQFNPCDGWAVRYVNNSKSNPGSILNSINGQPITDMDGTFAQYHTTFTDLSGLVIPISVTSMNYTFSGCTSLTTAPEIPNSVTNMDSTFSGCTSLTTAPEIPNSVTNMDSAFSGCESLTTAPEIPNGVTDMDNAFSYCTSLTTKPTIPSSVTTAEKYIFYGCTQFGY